MAKSDKPYHRRSDGAVVPATVQQGHSFYWQTNLSIDRMEEISAWIMTLTPEQRSYLRDIISDTREATSFDEAYEREDF